MMSPTQAATLQSSWAQVQPLRRDAAALFYASLFERNPALQALFSSPMAEQGERLMDMIGAAAALSAEPKRLGPVLQALGARHRGYGVRAEDYQTVGAALLYTLEAGLGAAFTDEVRSAWAAFYAEVADGMQAP